MRFLADEGWDAGRIDALRSDGHDILYVAEILRGATDDEALIRAFSEGRLLLYCPSLRLFPLPMAKMTETHLLVSKGHRGNPTMGNTTRYPD